MAGTKVSALTAGAALGGTEAIPAVQTAATVKITADQIKTFTSASPTLVTPVLGVATGTSLALGGATIGSNALAVTGNSTFTYGTSTLGLYLVGNGDGVATGVSSGQYQTSLSPYGLRLASGTTLTWSSSATDGRGSVDLTLMRAAAATLQHGAADAASPVAQTLKFQDVVAGTSNTAGVNATIQAPAGTGTGAGGSLIFQVAAAGSSGTAKNAWATALTIASTGEATFNGNIWLGGAANWIACLGRGGIGFAGDGVFEIFSTGYANNVRITAGASNLATFNGGITAGSILTTTASTTARASLNIPSGVAPTTPTNGDIWSDGSDLKVRLGGVTYTLTKV